MPTKRMLYRLLHDALVEMRIQGNERGDNLVFTLADVFHTVPLQLDRLDRGEISVQDVMSEVEERARWHGIEAWLELHMHEIARRHPETMENGTASE